MIISFCSIIESQRPANKRRKRKGSNSGGAANNVTPAPNKKRSPGPNFSLASQVKKFYSLNLQEKFKVIRIYFTKTKSPRALTYACGVGIGIQSMQKYMKQTLFQISLILDQRI